MERLVVFLMVVAASTCVLGVGIPYGSGAATAGGQAGLSGTTGTSQGSTSGAQAAGQFGTGATGSQTAGQFGTAATGQAASQFGSGNGAAFGGVRGVNTFPGSSGTGAQGGATFPRGTTGQGFASRVIQQEVAPTVTQTVTIDAFTTLTDTVFQSFEVTLTQFVVETATRPIQEVVVTPVDDFVAIRTTVVHRPEFITLTETKSDFGLAVRTSVTHVTLTHTSYAITHVPFTITATEKVHLTSPVVKTVISTKLRVVTDYHTIVDTVYIHGGYY